MIAVSITKNNFTFKQWWQLKGRDFWIEHGLIKPHYSVKELYFFNTAGGKWTKRKIKLFLKTINNI